MRIVPGTVLRRVRLWVMLALLAGAGVVIMHALHLTLGQRIAMRALVEKQEVLGHKIARLVAANAADPLLVNDPVTLYELVSTTVSEGNVAYCFIVWGGQVVSSSLAERTPPALVALRRPRDLAPIIVDSGERRVLDLAEPILGGDLGMVRLGLDMSGVESKRRQLATNLGLLAVGFIVFGLFAAFVIARSIARPLDDILKVADRFDPSRNEPVPEVSPRGTIEIATVGERFNRMMKRLRAAYAEQERARQKSVETERLVALGSLVAGVAHEVNNPLAGLKNCVRRIERSDLPLAKRREYLALMDEGLARIEDVVRQLLEFGRPHPPRLGPVAASRLARETLTLIGPALESRGIAIALLGDDADVLADRRLLEQALMNLLLNAAYVTPDGGEIRLRLRSRDGLVGVAVEDDGPGIPEEIRERILDPFFSTKPEGQGTGLGLSVTRTIADAHGGELTFEFPPNGGTVATVWLRASAAGVERAIA